MSRYDDLITDHRKFIRWLVLPWRTRWEFVTMGRILAIYQFFHSLTVSRKQTVVQQMHSTTVNPTSQFFFSPNSVTQVVLSFIRLQFLKQLSYKVRNLYLMRCFNYVHALLYCRVEELKNKKTDVKESYKLGVLNAKHLTKFVLCSQALCWSECQVRIVCKSRSSKQQVICWAKEEIGEGHETANTDNPPNTLVWPRLVSQATHSECHSKLF